VRMRPALHEAEAGCYEAEAENFGLGLEDLTSLVRSERSPHVIMIRDVTEPANIRMRISCAKSVGFGCGCGFVMRSKLPAIIVTVIQLSYLKLSSCN